MREVKRVEPLPGYEPDVGRWLWAMQDVRRRTLEAVEGIDQRVLDGNVGGARGTGATAGGDGGGDGGRENAIGTLLYHIALIETDWLYADLLCQPYPDHVIAEFPKDHRLPDGRLTPMTGIPLEQHLARLERTRAVFLRELEGMTLEEWRRLRAPDGADYEATPEWIVYHLVEHEAGHAYQISQLRRRAEQDVG